VVVLSLPMCAVGQCVLLCLATEVHVQLPILIVGRSLGRKVYVVPLLIKRFIRREKKSTYLIKVILNCGVLSHYS